MFTIADFKVGMKVYFGRRQGEKTLGEIVKLNATKAKVKTLENRGAIRERSAGVVWSVPYSLMTPADATLTTPQAKEPLRYNPLAGSDNLILEAIMDCYVGLSPENLACDGEASQTYIRQRSAELHRKLRGLFTALGREVDEGQAYEWYRQKQDHDTAKLPRT